MGSVLSSAHAAMCSFVNAQLDKMEERRLMRRFPQLRDLPAEERQARLRWFMDDNDVLCADDHRWQDPEVMKLRHLLCNYRHPDLRDVDNNDTSY